MSIVLQGSTSGSITLQEPAIAGSTVLSLPATTGTILTSASPASDLPSSIKGPAFSASVTAQSFSSGVITKIACNIEQFDTNNNYDSSTNFRFTPTIAGYYQVNGRIQVSTTNTNLRLIPYFNGSALINSLSSTFPSNFDTLSASWLIYCNGSTDYIEMYGQSGSTQNCACGFQAFLARSA